MNNINRYLKKVNWDTWESKPYVVLDPAVPGELMYFTEREYKSFQKVAMSNDITLRVVANPSSKPIDNPESIVSTPTLKIVSRVKSNLTRFLSGISGNKVRQASLKRLHSIFLSWGVSLALWTRQPLRSSGLYIETLAVSSYLKNLLRHNGSANMINAMKISLFAINSYLAGTPLTNTWALGQGVSLSHGLPTFIPASSRAKIRRGDTKTIRYYTSLLNSYKAFEGSYKEPDLTTIESPPFEGEIEDWVDKVEVIMLGLLLRAKTPNLEITPDNMFHSSKACAPGGMSVLSAPYGAWALLHNNLLDDYYSLCYHTGNHHIPLLLGDMVSRMKSKLQKSEGRQLWCGKLALKYEPASKIRIFAMPDYWTQVILSPIHDHLNSLLRLIPSDGTFDQEGAVLSLSKEGHTHFSSFDLKAATDTIPIQLYIPVMECIFGEDITKHWLNLMQRPWGLSWLKHQDKTIRYTRGQPIGAKSSWPAMALVHHLLVQYSALRCGHQPWTFEAYRVLGDDLVIADKKVADEYLVVSDELGIHVGLPKSYRSDRGFFNFANQSFLGSCNLSPLSLREELAAKSLSERSEFAIRMIRRGWLKSNNAFAALRHYVTPSAWCQLQFSTLGAFKQNVPDFVKQVMMIRMYPEWDSSIRRVTDPRFLETGPMWENHPLLGQVSVHPHKFTCQRIEYFAQFLHKQANLTSEALNGQIQVQYTFDWYTQMNWRLVQIIDSTIEQKMLRGGDFTNTGLRSWTGDVLDPLRDNSGFSKFYVTAVTKLDGPVLNFVDQVVKQQPDYPLQGLLSYLAQPLSKYMVDIFSLNNEMREWRTYVMYVSKAGERWADTREEQILYFGILLSIYARVQELPDFNIWLRPEIQERLDQGLLVSPWVLKDSRKEERHFHDTPPVLRRTMDAVMKLLADPVIRGSMSTE